MRYSDWANRIPSLFKRVSDTEFTCPRCLRSVPRRPETRFCPHCGLADALAASLDTAPLDVTDGGRIYRVHERYAIGSISTIYRCRWQSGRQQVEGVFKIAREAVTNGLVAQEADILRHLHSLDTQRRFIAFLPAIEASFGFGGGSAGPPRQANVLRMHEEIHSPEELYTLGEVRIAYPAGLDGRDVAWIWRRLLTVLGFAHSHGVVHGAVLPMHVLIEPREHKLLLIDWCCARRHASSAAPVSIMGGDYRSWYKRHGGTRQAPTAGLDVGFAARCIIELLGGDPVSATFPPAFEPALTRYFQRCMQSTGGTTIDTWKLLDDFDQLIDVLWGPRRFRVLAMPPTHVS